jgi:hypothetical protein
MELKRMLLIWAVISLLTLWGCIVVARRDNNVLEDWSDADRAMALFASILFPLGMAYIFCTEIWPALIKEREIWPALIKEREFNWRKLWK